METPMAYAVSDTSRRNARHKGASAVSRPKSRRPARHLAIHWPRVIALALNTLVWVAIILAARRFLHL
jgi:hypothetical protein